MKSVKGLFCVLITFVCLGMGAMAFEINKDSTSFVTTAQKSSEIFGSLNSIEENFLYSPEDTVTVAEAITVVARLCAVSKGEIIPDDSGLWYEKYINYANEKGIAVTGLTENLMRPAKRHEMATLLASGLPSGCFAKINNVTRIPDVSQTLGYHRDLLMLYNAGIMMGSDSYGNFRPEDDIKRGELATVINRIVFEDKRLTKELDKISDDDAYVMSITSMMNSRGNKEGIASGWLYDGRGAFPRTDIKSTYATLFDIRTDQGTALIREFNKTSTGVLTVYANAIVTGAHTNYSGIYLEFQNDTGDSVFRIQTVNEAWCILRRDGEYSPIYSISPNETRFDFEFIIDLDNNRATVFINYTPCGEFPLVTTGEQTNILNFRYATTPEGTPYFVPGILHIYSNYAVMENFSYNNGSELPRGWTGNNAEDIGDVLHVHGEGCAMRKFSPVSDTVIAETLMLLPNKERVEFALKSGDKTVVSFTSDGADFYANGQKVYDNFYENLWYKLRLEADTVNQTVLVKLNGKKLATIPFAEKTTSADGVYIGNEGVTTAWFDDIKVFRSIEREDYVPAPVVPRGEDKYVVGMNVCSLWRNEAHFGWHCISPYDDPTPVLGYYDEGLSETADWELKYIIEHGIDFQAFCIYANATDGPQRYDAVHLYDGFMNAKYSDMSKFCIIWEAGNASSPKSFDAWKNHYVPYFIEYYFKDPRHITIDNRLVLCVFGANNLPKRLNGTNADVKVLFDYLEEEVKKLGFDGMIYLACGSSSTAFAEMGFDGCYAYNWGTTGYLYENNVKNITNSAKNDSVYTVPTISVGFNSIPWHGTRYPMMSMNDFERAQEWVKSSYLTTYPTEPWQEKFVMLSTWNEYGEGTYLMPTTDERGFGYLDILREAYTDEAADPSLNTIPTEQQRYRINRLYPQYRRLLRREGYFNPDVSYSESMLHVDYSTYTDYTCSSIISRAVSEEGVSGVTNGDAIIQIKDVGGNILLDEAIGFKVKIKAPKGSTVEVFFTTSSERSLSQAKSVNFITTSDEMTEYFVRGDQNASWRNRLVCLRVDPVSTSGVPFVLKSIDVMKYAKTSKITINDQSVILKYDLKIKDNAEVLLPFDPSLAIDFRLNIFHKWNKDTKSLEFNLANNNRLVFTVGSSVYLENGVPKMLGYAIEEIDGLPIVPLGVICRSAGYSFDIADDGEVTVNTDQKPIFDIINQREKGKWEFESNGDSEGWYSSIMSTMVIDGYMLCQTLEQTNDPLIRYSVSEEFNTEDYRYLDVKVRYKYDSNLRQFIKIYFTTDRDTTENEAKSYGIYLNKTDTDGEWETYRVDLTGNSHWKNMLRSIRIDPFYTEGYMEFDYIRLVK